LIGGAQPKNQAQLQPIMPAKPRCRAAPLGQLDRKPASNLSFQFLGASYKNAMTPCRAILKLSHFGVKLGHFARGAHVMPEITPIYLRPPPPFKRPSEFSALLKKLASCFPRWWLVPGYCGHCRGVGNLLHGAIYGLAGHP
jgi:hypothetical protein